LLKKNIPAIFFCIGKNMAKYEDDLIYAINNGFIIGNHAFNHKHFSDLNLKDAYKEIRDTDKIIELLSKGGSESPKDIVSAIGLDITKEELWEKGFVVIREMIEKLENKS